MVWKDINALCDVVRQTSFEIHCYHRNGHLEKVYENALRHRLVKKGLRVEQQHALSCLLVFLVATPGRVSEVSH